MNKLFLSLALLLASSVQAKCITNDAWTGPDKNLHAIAGFSIAYTGTYAFKSETAGFYLGVAAAVAKEAYDATGRGQCSLQDALVTIGAAAVGAKTGGYFFLPTNGGVVAGVVKQF